MNFTNWKYYTDFFTKQNIGIVSPDGKESRLLIDPDVIVWLSEGNIPLPADEAHP